MSNPFQNVPYTPYGGTVNAANTATCPICGSALPPWGGSLCPSCASTAAISPNGYLNTPQWKYIPPPPPFSPDARVALVWAAETDGAPRVQEFPSSEAALEKVRELQGVLHGPIKLLEVTHIWNPEWKHEEIKGDVE
jgi:hypothetical protein